eukprot:Em0775g1a
MKTAEDLKRLIEANCNDGDVRLVGGTSPLNGRVEVCYHNQWGGVCSRYTWSQNQATVVCRQLGYLYDAVAYSSGYGDATTTFLIVDGCDVSADQLLACYSYGNGRSPSTLGYYTCSGYNNFVVNCTQPIPEYCSGTCTNGSIRLVGGPSPYKGRLELYDYNLCNHNGDVGVHCAAPTSTCLNGDARLVNGSTPLGDEWSDTSGANTVCEQLGYSPSNATAYVYSYFGSYKGGIFVLDVHCDATADKLVDCSFYYQSVYHFCYDGSTAGVRCQGMPTSVCTDGTVRLAGDLTPYEGRVEIIPLTLDYNVKCPSSDNYICYDHTRDIGVRCAPAVSSQCLDGDVRLVNGTNGTIGPGIIEGMVEIFYGGQWGVVTGSVWTLSEASVVCRQLHYAPVALKALMYSRDIVPAGNITFHNSIVLVTRKRFLTATMILLVTMIMATILCSSSCYQCQDGTIRLVNGNSSYEGRVEVCEGGCWGPVCIGDSGWSSLDAAVVCNQLTMGSQGAVPRYYYSLTSPPMLAPHCTGYESSLFNCAQSVCHIENYNYAGVECSPVDELLHRMDFYIGKLSNSLTE